MTYQDKASYVSSQLWRLCRDIFHWKCNIPEIHKLEKLKFLRLSRYRFKLRCCSIRICTEDFGFLDSEDFGSVAFSVETVVPAPQVAEVYIFKSPCAVQFAMYCTITAELVRGIFLSWWCMDFVTSCPSSFWFIHFQKVRPQLSLPCTVQSLQSWFVRFFCCCDEWISLLAPRVSELFILKKSVCS